jgi:hypothetical protein
VVHLGPGVAKAVGSWGGDSNLKPLGEGLDPVPCCFAGRGGSGECCATCASCTPAVTLVPTEDQRFPMLHGPSADQGDRDHGRLWSPPCADACGTRSSATGTGSACRARLAVSALGGLGGAGRWSALAASRSWSGEGLAVLRWLVAIPQIGV